MVRIVELVKEEIGGKIANFYLMKRILFHLYRNL